MSKVRIIKNHEVLTTTELANDVAQYFSHGHCVSANTILSNDQIYKLGLDFDSRIFVEAVEE